MQKWKAPENCGGISVGGAYFATDDTGHIHLPEEGDYGQALIPHGFTPAGNSDGAEPKAAKSAHKKAG